MAQVWEKLRDELEQPYRWARVKGPMSSDIATLYDWGFEPTQIDLWTDPTGVSWALDYEVAPVAAIKEVLRSHFLKEWP